MEPIVLMGLLVVVYGGYISWLDCRQGVRRFVRRCMGLRRFHRGKRSEGRRGMAVVGMDCARFRGRRRAHATC